MLRRRFNGERLIATSSSRDHIMISPRILGLIGAALLLASDANAQDGWLLVRGNALRTGAASGLPAWKERFAWQRPLFMDKLDGFDLVDDDHAAKDLVQRLDSDKAILPAGMPMV